MQTHDTIRAAAPFILVALAACADSTTPEPVGGETHFLHACDGAESCGLGLDCVCGVCTETCLTDNSCKDQSGLATCEPAGTPNGACDNPLSSPVCDVQCDSNADCDTLGTGYSCESGSCRKLAEGSCIAGGVIYADGAQYSLDACNSCLCNNGTFNCTGIVCADSGMDAGSDATDPDTGVGAQIGDAEIDATESFPIDTGLIAAADRSCDVDGGVGPFTPKELDPVPTCVELDDLTAIAGSEVLAFSADGIQTTTQSDTDIFWVLGSDVYRVAKSGGDPLQFGTFRGDPRALLVDGCQLYLAGGDFMGALGSKSLANGSDTLLADFPDVALVSDIVADDDNFYLFADEALQRIPRSGGPIVTIATRSVLHTVYDSPVLVATDTDFYWLDGPSAIGHTDRVMTMPKIGDARPRVLVSQLARPVHIHWRNGFLYVLNDGNRDSLGNYIDGGGLIRVDPTNGAVETLDTFSGAIDLASDDQHVYWIHQLANAYSVSRIPITGSATPTPIFATLRGRGRGLIVDASSLYWQSECSSDGFSSSFIVRIPKPAP